MKLFGIAYLHKRRVARQAIQDLSCGTWEKKTNRRKEKITCILERYVVRRN